MKKSIIALLLLLLAMPIHAKTTIQKLYEIRHDVPQQRVYRVAKYIDQYSEQYDVERNLVIAFIDVESDLYNIKGPTGEAGYMQIRPNTFQRTCGYETTLNRIIYNVKEQIRCGIKHIHQLQKRYNWYSAISAYNYGYPTKNNSDYVKEVLNNYNELSN